MLLLVVALVSFLLRFVIFQDLVALSYEVIVLIFVLIVYKVMS